MPRPGPAATTIRATGRTCVRSFFLLCDRAGRHTGLWSIEFTDHAIGRLVSDARSPLALTAVETMLAAHRAILAASATFALTHADDFLLRVDDGVFRCSATAPEMEHGGRQLFVRADSWLHSAQLGPDQHPVPEAADQVDRLGNRLLLPRPLRKIAA